MSTNQITEAQARSLMHEWVDSPSLRHHMECVAACMGHHADIHCPDQKEIWIVAGLLHDMDYQKHPTAEEHPFVAVEHLRKRGDVSEEVLQAILGHATYSGVSRDSDMARHLFACDELAGFIVACSKVRPDGVRSLTTRSVKKKIKDARFAAAVSREDMSLGMEELGVEPEAHIQSCIDALAAQADRLEL